MEEKTIDKIRKLIAKQKSAEEIGSLQEANIFAAKVQELLTKHNLEIADIGDAQEKPKMGKSRFKDIITRKNEGKWEPLLYAMLCDYHYCMAINHDLQGRTVGVSIIGTPENIEIVKFLGDQLQVKLRIIEKLDWDNRGRHFAEKRNKFRRGFFLGAIKGIREQLETQRRVQMATQVKVTDLVVQTKRDLEKAAKEYYSDLKEGRYTKSSSTVGKVIGYERGKKLNINQGIESSNLPKPLI